MGVSLIIASFCDGAVWKLILTQGIMFSIGASLRFIPSMSIPSQWFTKYRPLAIGIALSGSGIGAICATAGYFTPLFDLPSFSTQVIGKSSSFSTNLLTIVNAASTVGRLAAGQLTLVLGLINTLSLCTLGAALSILIFWLPFHSTGTIIVCAIIFGFSCGGFISLLPLVMANTWGVQRISTIIGLLYVACFIGTMVGAPSSGAILDNIGKGTDYKTLLFSLASL
ncbi:hypothetical protein LPJ81_004233 [Coemansia sp. IMI 209127]|nr:hypothetical protein LPJ81_004233 [Coemansia sp. IMI 209127]